MSPGIENHVDWTAAATPHGEQVGPGLSRPRAARAPAPAPAPRRSVMDTLLGENKLAALDEHGADPYNATGRQFRR
jgi:hypothetical protein